MRNRGVGSPTQSQTQVHWLKGKDSTNKFYWFCTPEGTNGVGILLAKNWTGNVFEVQLISNRIILLQLIIGETVYTLIQCVNPNKAGLPQKKSASIASCNKSKTWFLLARYLFHLVTGMAM